MSTPPADNDPGVPAVPPQWEDLLRQLLDQLPSDL